jgi:hypothetical protein
VCIVLALIWGAKTEGGHKSEWSQAIALASLAVTTALLYGTGKKDWTVVEAIMEGDTVKYPCGRRLSQDEYDALTQADRGKVRKQRGAYFRALYVGLDGRWSTSKLQALLWTYAVLYALVALFVADQLGLDFSDGKGFAGIEFRDEYLLLLGGPFAAAVLAKGIMATKVENGTIVKPEAPTERSAVTGFRDVISDDAGRTDLVDFQYFFFNLVALGFFAVSFCPNVAEGFPDLPDFLVGLTSVSALAYVTSKAVESSTPQITLVVPSTAFPEQTVEVRGTYLASLGELPLATVDGLEATVAILANAPGPTNRLKVTLPKDLPAGEDKEITIGPPGATVPATSTIDIVKVQIADVDPKPFPRLAGTHVTVTGTNFGATTGNVEVDAQKLDVVDWSADRIIAKLGTDLDAASAGKKEKLRVEREVEGAKPHAAMVVEIAP